MSNGISFNCDSCGREVYGCNIVNGMKFCAKCYQEIFGETNKDKQIAELQKQLEEKKKELREIRVENYTIKSYRDFLDNNCKNLIKNNKRLKQQLKSQPAEIVEKIKRTVVPVARLTKSNEIRIELNVFFKVLDDILQEYQKGEN